MGAEGLWPCSEARRLPHRSSQGMGSDSVCSSCLSVCFLLGGAPGPRGGAGLQSARRVADDGHFNPEACG